MTKTLLSLLLEELRRLPRLPRLPRRFQFDAALLESLRQVAEREQRSEDEVAADLLEAALAQRGAHEARIQVWESLSPREQQVAALACLGRTNRQIAAQLYLSPETIKTHMRHAQRKFGVANKADLRALLADWDFGGWG
jgi:DNA-binding CsgD family transcriptional regulator